MDTRDAGQDNRQDNSLGDDNLNYESLSLGPPLGVGLACFGLGEDFCGEARGGGTQASLETADVAYVEPMDRALSNSFIKDKVQKQESIVRRAKLAHTEVVSNPDCDQ